MAIYWVLFLIPLVGLLLPLPLDRNVRRLAWLTMGAVTALIVGLRHEIGADWDPYTEIFRTIQHGGAQAALVWTDPGYALINWISAVLGWDVYGVNLICGAIFATGLARFASRQPIPWLAWLIATPYLLIVVVMGYSRQGVALGLVLLALSYLQEQRHWRFALWCAVAALFHKTALFMLPLAFIGRPQKSWLDIAALVILIPVAAAAFIYSQFEYFWTVYIAEGLQSEGTMMRLLMNAVPAILMLSLGRRWNHLWPHSHQWRYMAWAAIGSIFLAGIASTAVDRIALYLAPLQLYVWTRVPLLLRDAATRTAVVCGICITYAAILWVWLNFSLHANWWVPYRSILFNG